MTGNGHLRALGRATRFQALVSRGSVGRAGYSFCMRLTAPPKQVLVRELIGESLREERMAQNKTLRAVSQSARVSLGYLSEVERGQKEASSELLAAICAALDLPLSVILNLVSEKMAAHEQLSQRVAALPTIHDTVAQAAA